MNAVEIEEAVSNLALQPFDGDEFPYAFLVAFGNKDTTIKKLRSTKNSSNSSDIGGGVLQRSNIHIAGCAEGDANNTLIELKQSPATSKGKVKIILATDGVEFVAEDLNSGETVACAYGDFANHFGFFLSLAGITTTKEIRNNAVDIQATGRLNRLYVELLKENQDWDTAERRHDLNQFMSRLIFCYFAEDTGIFPKEDMFTHAIEQISDSRSENADFVISKIFHAMDVKREDRDKENLPNWTRDFPYVNGGLFAGNRDVPKFSRIARSYLIHAGNLNWKEINPDIFGSMIQAVADDEERGSIGMHYTSVPNILKVLNPLYLDDLRESLQEAGDNHRKLINLRKRISKIRVFDPACGSGNFLVIAYKEMRQIESEINNRRDESHLRSEIPLSNFRGIELREFATEIARLALIIAEYQCDEQYRGQKDALADFLPLDSKNWIVHGNALRIDWLSVCPPTEKVVEHFADDFFHKPQDQAQIDFENEGGETYICGNPPYLGNTWQSQEQKEEIKKVVAGRTNSPGFLDYVSGWFLKAADWLRHSQGQAAFVSTNSVCQGQMVPLLWPMLLDADCEISFAHTSFKWSNLAAYNAGVVVVIIGLSFSSSRPRLLFEETSNAETLRRVGESITPYLTIGKPVIVQKKKLPLSKLAVMEFGNKPSDGGNLLLDSHNLDSLNLNHSQRLTFIKRIMGSSEFIKGQVRYCIWIEDTRLEEAQTLPEINNRIKNVRALRLASRDKGANALAKRAHQLKLMRIGCQHTIVVPSVSSDSRPYLPVGLVSKDVALTNLAFGLYDAPLWSLALVASKIHLLWIATVCGRLGTGFRYSNTLGWNTFPVPALTEKNKLDLTRCAEDILLAREKHFPATIADLYKSDAMPENLKQAHEKNDETLERIYIGRRFNNDTERLEKLFELYTKMTSSTNGKETLESAS
ncbi:lactate dehydrogenase [Porticoccaceae bacterium]|nr:lactate dehydrogenase [Porticoccaceae bacterium]